MSTNASASRFPSNHQTAPGNVTHCLECQTECQAPYFGCACCREARKRTSTLGWTAEGTIASYAPGVEPPGGPVTVT